jgi:hypothetical protein
MAMLALAFTSCKKNETKLSFIATINEPEVVNDDRIYLTPTKDLFFEQGEQVMLYNIKYEENDVTPHSYYGVYTCRTTGPRVFFDYQSGPIYYHPDKADAFFGFYPGQRVNNAYLAQGNVGVFDIPTTQVYREINGSAAFAERSWAAAGKRTDMESIEQEFYFTFQSIMGALGLWLKTDGEEKIVKSIVYEDKMFNVTGDVHLKIHEIDPDEMMWLFNNYDPNSPTYMQRLNEYIDATGYFVDGNKGKTITLDCGEGVVINGTRKPFYIVLRPLASYAGRTITVNFADGSQAVIDDDVNRKIAPGQIRNREENVSQHMVP